MERHKRSNSLKCKPNIRIDNDPEPSSYDIYNRRQSTDSPYSRRGSFGQKTLRPHIGLGRVYEGVLAGSFDETENRRSSGPKLPTHFNHRPGSYLTRSTSEYRRYSRRFSHSSTSIGSDDHQEDETHEINCDKCTCNNCMCENCQCMEIVTPFAQVLTKLHSVRENLEHVLNVLTEQGVEFTNSLIKSGDNEDEVVNNIDGQPYLQESKASLANLDWCLNQLEKLCSHQSVADMTRQKFNNLLAIEVNKLSKSKSGIEISEFILNTFTESMKPNPSLLRAGISRNQSAPNLAFSRSQSRRSLSDHKSNDTDVKSISINWKIKKSDVILDHSFSIPKYGVFTKQEEQLGMHLSQINNWGLDIFRLNELSNGFPLTTVAFKIFQERNILQEFQILPTTFINYFTSLEKNYLSVPYHNSNHAADVMQSTHVLLSLPTLKNLFSPYEITAALFAAAVHDVGHPGATNQYLVNSESELALLYNDNSVLENYHAAVAFKLLQTPELDIFSNLSIEERKIMRRLVVDIVLATDMTKHMMILARMQTMMETRNVTGNGKEEERLHLLEALVHCTDISNPTKPLDQYKVWAELVFEEFFNQGDKEREAGVVVSPNCDRNIVSIADSQIAFIDYIVRPMWETLSNFVDPDAKNILEQLDENYSYFQEKAKVTQTTSICLV